MNQLCERIETLESNFNSLSEQQVKTEKTVVDLQCRSMRDNMIFTGISEVELGGNQEYENVEKTLFKFLQDEMGISRHLTSTGSTAWEHIRVLKKNLVQL